MTFAYDDVKRRTDDGIQERKKRLQHNEIINTDSLKKLIQLFCQQAKYDENLRNLKIWLEELSDSTKFNSLSKSLVQFGVHMNDKECQRVFKVE